MPGLTRTHSWYVMQRQPSKVLNADSINVSINRGDDIAVKDTERAPHQDPGWYGDQACACYCC
jgi:hypothetical protein